MPDRRLVLFEDEGNDGELQELSELLKDFEWEGGNHGITVWLEVNVGDTIVIGDDGGIRVEKKV